jgi:hypothetical protein
MKRLPLLGSALLLCTLCGCAGETYEGLIDSTIEHINYAAVDVGIIKTKVVEATKRSEGGKKLDLTEAIEATKSLNATGKKTQEIKRKIEHIRANVDPEQKKINAETKRGKLNAAMTDLLKQKADLQAALAEAERLPNVSNAKEAVAEFRIKLTEAESPFEALSR